MNMINKSARLILWARERNAQRECNKMWRGIRRQALADFKLTGDLHIIRQWEFRLAEAEGRLGEDGRLVDEIRSLLAALKDTRVGKPDTKK